MHFHCAPRSILCYSSEICFTGLVSLLYVFIILYSNVCIAPDCTKQNERQSSFILYVFFPLLNSQI